MVPDIFGERGREREFLNGCWLMFLVVRLMHRVFNECIVGQIRYLGKVNEQ